MNGGGHVREQRPFSLRSANQNCGPGNGVLVEGNVQNGQNSAFERPLPDVVNNPNDLHRRLRQRIIVNLLSYGVFGGKVRLGESAIHDGNEGLRIILSLQEVASAE